MRLKILVLLGILFVVLFSVGVSARTCTIKTSCNADNTVMKLSSSTNAHGETWDQSNYDQYLCCDFTGTHTCSGNNKILKLSSNTNAHAEIATGAAYSTDVCFGDLNCESATGSCASGMNIILRLSGETNAHIAGPSETNYDTLICCDIGEEPCGNGVIDVGENCDGTNWGPITGCSNFDEFTGGTLSCNSNCVFDTINCIGGTEGVCGDGIVNRGETCDGTNWGPITGCSNFDEFTGGSLFCVNCGFDTSSCTKGESCSFTSPEWSSSEVSEGTLVELIVEGINCDGKEVKFEVFEKELIGRNPAQTNPANAVFNGNSATGTWIAEWIDDGFGQGNPEYVFKASLVSDSNIFIDDSEELTVLPDNLIIDECDNITSCSNYMTSEECVSDLCEVAEGSVEANNPLITCGEGGVSCECVWVSNNCEPSYTSFAGDYIVGICSYDESTTDDCEDGFLSYFWTASWAWGHDGWVDWNDGPSGDVNDYVLDNGKYYYDPYGQFEGCQNGSTIVECPASIQVGFFGVWNFIIAVIILVGVYFVMESKFLRNFHVSRRHLGKSKKFRKYLKLCRFSLR